jgi:hypothetical protein
MHARHPGQKAAEPRAIRINEPKHVAGHTELVLSQLDPRPAQNFLGSLL